MKDPSAFPRLELSQDFRDYRSDCAVPVHARALPEFVFWPQQMELWKTRHVVLSPDRCLCVTPVFGLIQLLLMVFDLLITPNNTRARTLHLHAKLCAPLETFHRKAEQGSAVLHSNSNHFIVVSSPPVLLLGLAPCGWTRPFHRECRDRTG